MILIIPAVALGVRRMETFFNDEDYEVYLRLMREWCDAAGVEVWTYCLMPNHTHLIAVPESEESLARGIGEAHRRYTRYINFKKGWKGYLWQGRLHHFQWMRITCSLHAGILS